MIAFSQKCEYLLTARAIDMIVEIDKETERNKERISGRLANSFTRTYVVCACSVSGMLEGRLRYRQVGGWTKKMTAGACDWDILRVAVALILCARSARLAAGVEAEISLDVEGNGFHRMLIYRVNFMNLTNHDCQAAIHLEMPSALYVNVDEIAELRRRRVSTVCSTGETNVELFTENAERQNVTTCATVNSLAGCNLTIPVHRRYHYAQEDGSYVNVVLLEPKLLLGCREKVRGHRVSKMDLCEPCASLATKWREIPYTVSSGHDYIWVVPIGDVSLLTLVTCVTLTVTIISAVLIARAMHENASRNHRKKD